MATLVLLLQRPANERANESIQPNALAEGLAGCSWSPLVIAQPAAEAPVVGVLVGIPAACPDQRRLLWPSLYQETIGIAKVVAQEREGPIPENILAQLMRVSCIQDQIKHAVEACHTAAIAA
jgi:hypothetical protein